MKRRLKIGTLEDMRRQAERQARILNNRATPVSDMRAEMVIAEKNDQIRRAQEDEERNQ